MKKILQLFVCFSLIAFIFTGCDREEPVVPIEQFALTNLLGQQSEKVEKLMQHTVNVATDGVTATYNEASGQYTYSGTGNCLKVTFVCKERYINGIIYALAKDLSTEGTYANAEWITVSEGSATSEQITGGNITVEADAKTLTVSSIKGNIRLDDIKKGIEFKGNIVYEAEPVLSGYTYAVNITDVYSATFSIVPGVKKYQIFVADPDGVPAGEFDAILPEGTTSIVGSYTVASNYPSDPYLMDAGYNFPDWGFSGGTQYVNDKGAKFFVTGGTIEIIKTEQGWITISGKDVATTDAAGAAGTGSFVIENMPETAIVIGGGEDDNGTEYPTILESSYNTYSGNLWTTKMLSDGVTGVYNAATWGYDYTGTGYLVSFDLITDGDPGRVPVGTYTPGDNGAATVGNFVKGYDSGWAGLWGSVIGVITDGVKVDEAIIDGSLEVTETKITFEFKTANGTYKGFHNL